MIFDVPNSNDPRFFEAYVLAIDSQRKVCKLLTDFKQALDGVPWAHGIEEPVFNDRVQVSTILGYPLIHGILSSIGEPSSYSPDIDAGTEIDTGNYSPLSRNLVHDPEKPKDIVSEDRVVSNRMGGLFGLLKGGSFVARASKLSQILLSKYDDLVRIVGRNFELFTDACTDVVVSVRGRIYRFTGYADTLSNSRSNTYKYQEHVGDTVLSSLLQGNYYGYNPTTFAILPAANDTIRKYLITGTPNNLFQQDVHLTGQYYTIVQNAAGTASTYVDQTNATFDIKTLNGTFTRITTTPTSVVITYNGTNIVTIDSGKIKADFGGTNTVTIDSGKIEADFGGLTKCTLDSAKAQLNYVSGGNTVSANATGVELLFSGGTHFIRATTAGITMG